MSMQTKETKDPKESSRPNSGPDSLEQQKNQTEDTPIPEEPLDDGFSDFHPLPEDLAFDRDVHRRRRARRKKRQQEQTRFFLAVVVVLALLLILIVSRCRRPAEETQATPSPSVSGQETASFWGQVSIPTPSPSPSIAPYDFTQPVPESSPVEDSYFSDAVFIGDSRTVGFFLYSGLEGSTSYASQGLNVKAALTGQTVSQADGTKISVIDALRNNPQFSKVYIMLGLNELGWVNLDIFQDYYEQLIDAVREINPDAIIYVQSLLPVSQKKSESSSTYNNTRVAMFNERVIAVAENKKAFYVNVAEAVEDENGYLPADVTADGVHLQKTACEQWLAYLKTHTVSEETAAANRVPASPAPSESVAPSTSPSESVAPSTSPAS